MQDLSRRTLLRLAAVAPLAGSIAATEVAAGSRTSDKNNPSSVKNNTPEAARIRIQEKNFPNVPLISHEGKRVNFYDDLIKGKVVTVNFFYAKCDEICPLVSANLAKVQKILGDQVGRDIFMYSISLKPEEDNLDAIRAYRDSWHAGPGWTFFTGQPSDIEKIRKGIGFTYPEPAIDKDKTQHIGNIRYGNEPLMLWAACPGVAHAPWIAESFTWMMHPETNRVQKS
jgi:protein SCO1/2